MRASLWQLGQVLSIVGVVFEDIPHPSSLVSLWQEWQHCMLATSPLNRGCSGVNLHAETSCNEVHIA